jgi:small-conductance mechanosensitive channel
LYKTQASIDGNLASLKKEIADQNGKIDELQAKLGNEEDRNKLLEDQKVSLKNKVSVLDGTQHNIKELYSQYQD